MHGTVNLSSYKNFPLSLPGGLGVQVLNNEKKKKKNMLPIIRWVEVLSNLTSP